MDQNQQWTEWTVPVFLHAIKFQLLSTSHDKDIND